MGVHDATRLLTSSTPLARARMRAQGVVGRLKRLLMDKVGGDFEATQLMAPPSAPLQQAMARAMPSALDQAGARTSGGGLHGGGVVMGSVHVEQAATELRQRTTELKQAASTPTEKATIEVVALMFQAILAEERIPPSVRVWFARLQIPVLRVALAEPEFFSALQHPARRLIDRMGSCVLGFESNVGSAALEAEIKRVVQVIEQYPETGRRVFQLVYDEFQKFLSTYLSEQGSASRFVSVAQQVEQKETLSVQYTIELRKLLDDDDTIIAVSVSETKLRFATPEVTLTSKVIDGTFPDYSRVIPTGNAKRLEVDAAEFARAVDRVATVSSERSRAVKMTLDEDRLVLSVNAPDSGAAEEELAVAYSDDALEIGFNAKYLLEIASQVDRENAVFLFNSAGDPTLMREGGDESAVYVVMPMRV